MKQEYQHYMEFLGADMTRVETLLKAPVSGQEVGIIQAVDGLVESGGKRLRPALALLSGHLCQANIDQAIHVAASVELLHTATLVHDDLIDGALMRRGTPTLNSYLPSGAVILIGDFLFARSAALVGETGHAQMMRVFADTLSTICNGEIQQMFSRRDPCQHLARATYDQRIYAKTASLFALCSKAGAVIGNADEQTVATLHEYGKNLGMAFQIVDDALDFMGDQNELGKPVGEDLRHGLVTLPTLYFLETHPDHYEVMTVLEQHTFHGACETLGGDNGENETMGQDESVVAAAIAAVRSSDALERTFEDARRLAQAARDTLNDFPPSPYRDIMWGLAGFAAERSF
ncbi:MAG: polyprenyl synthetase family protein [Chloroflexi bacterium]|nr:polyprenyl synthetase family protein [Chloroflexota bacterium]